MQLASADVSEYELQRQENIRRNQQLLEQLGLGGGEASFGAAAKRIRKPPAQRIHRAPERRSARITGSRAPELYVAAETEGGAITLGGTDAAAAAAWARRGLDDGLEDAEPPPGPVARLKLGVMPEEPSHLLSGEREAFDALRATKQSKARELGVAGYHVLPIRALCVLVRRMPASVAELSGCWGFGEKKMAAFGELFVTAVRPWLPTLREAQRAAMEGEEEEDKEQEEGQQQEETAQADRKAEAGGSAADSGGSAAESAWDAEAAAARGAGSHRNIRLLDAADTEDFADAELARLFEPKYPSPRMQPRPPSRTASMPDVTSVTGDTHSVWPLPLPKTPEELERFELPAFEALVSWKRERAKEWGYNDPCVVCHNRTLCELVRLLPSTKLQMLGVYGIGQVRFQQHGRQMLKVLDTFRQALLAHRAAVAPAASAPEAAAAAAAPLAAARPCSRTQPRAARRGTDGTLDTDDTVGTDRNGGRGPQGSRLPLTRQKRDAGGRPSADSKRSRLEQPRHLAVLHTVSADRQRCLSACTARHTRMPAEATRRSGRQTPVAEVTRRSGRQARIAAARSQHRRYDGGMQATRGTAAVLVD